MTDLIQKIDAATTQLTLLQRERVECEAGAVAHEQAAREQRLRLSQIKQEMAQLQAVIGHAQVATSVQKAQQDAEAARAAAQQHAQALADRLADAESALGRLGEKERMLDALLIAHKPVENPSG